MPDELRSILFEDLEIVWPGFRLRRLALNQHMPRVEKLSEHVHPFQQMLLYLRGHGSQMIDGETFSVRRGSTVLIPPGCRHRFVKTQRLAPVCLAIDVESGTPETAPVAQAMRPQAISRIEGTLVALNREDNRRSGARPVQVAALILEIVALIEDTALNAATTQDYGRSEKSVRGAIAAIGLEEASAAAVASRLGRSLDHLNRVLGTEIGVTVGEIVSQLRRERSCELLRSSSLSIGEIGAVVGIDDQNYFSRWFRKQTGQTPSGWRKAGNY